MSIGSHGLEVGRDYELTIGSSFQSGRARDAYHLMRYDFKPASIDTNRPAHFEIGEANQCVVTIPNTQDSSSSATTTYKGGKKPCTKECVLIIDKQTGQITLERITSTIPLKKCRSDKQSMVPKAHSEMENMEVMEKSMNLKKMLKDKRQPPKGDKSEKKGGSSSGSSGSSKQSKDAPPGTTTTPQGSASKSSSKHSSSSSHAPPPTPPSNSSSLNNPPQSTQQQPPASGALNASNGNSNGTIKNAPANVPARQRLMSSSDMSVSSASSDSSDSDSSDEGGDSKSQPGVGKSSKPSNPPPPKLERSPSKPNHESQQQQQRQQSFPPRADPSPAKSMQQPPPAPKVDRSPAKPLPKEATVKGKEKAFLSTLQSDLQLSDSDGSDSD